MSNQEFNSLIERTREQIIRGDYAGAAKIWEQVVEDLTRESGDDHPDLAVIVEMLADLYQKEGKYSKAEIPLQRSLFIREKALGAAHPDVASSLNKLALLYREQGQLSKAEPLARRSLFILENSFGPDHQIVATSLTSLARLYRDQGQYSKAEPLYQRSLVIREKALGADHIDTAISLTDLADLYRMQGQYSKAEPFYQRSLLIREMVLGVDHPDVARSAISLADLFRAQGQYNQAEPLFQRSVRNLEMKLGADHPHVAQSIEMLANLYQDMGQYSKAEPLYKRSLLIREKVLGADHPNVANSLTGLADLYRHQGKHSQAEPLFRRSLAIWEKVLGADHPTVAGGLNNLAMILWLQGKYDKAQPLYQRSLLIREKTLGPDHPEISQSLNNLALLYQAQGKYNKAESLFRRSYLIWKKVLGAGHPAVAGSLNNLANLYQRQGFYSKAEPLYRRALLIREKALGVEHPDVATSLDLLSTLYQVQGQVSQSLKTLQRSEHLRLKWLKEQLPLSSSNDRTAQLVLFGSEWVRLFTLIPRGSPTSDLALKIRLNRQGMLQDIEQRQVLLLRNSGTAKEQVEQLRGLTQRLASVSLPPERRAALRQQRDELQAALYRQLPDLQLQGVSVQDVAKALPIDGALVEFQRFQPFDGKQPPGKRWGSPRFVALILRSDGAITPVQLGLAQPIDTAILRALQASAGNTSDATALWGKVSQLVLQPLQPHLAGTRQWFLSPDGDLNRVPFAAIPSPQQPAVPLAQAVQLRQLTTGRDLLRLQRPAKAGEKPLVMANPSYDRAQAQAPVIAAATASNAERPQQRSSRIDSTRWAPLPATQLEGQQVAALLGTQPVTGPQATTKALQQRQGPRVLHIATHGFFAPDQDTPPSDPLRAVQDSSRQLRGFQGEDPQLRSGLVLAGANQPDADPNDDGYLTAAEATGLQLDGTELVTLSACSTAQGAIKTGEGVYGLQRSLTVAGARSTMLSLWKVDDAATAEFMQRFYKRLKAGEGRADALQAVQQEFRTDPSLKARGWDSIFYWGAWQLVGDWRPIQGL
ncbi:tetratricopeptide repeat protein [Vulcanococcus limneticus]|uniref:CHAT domain-containing tetratricopeptide repeat protein n=1 Tax=Vulcanococcus limneticus TaxID=2170428 RepID=UPI00398BDE09